MPLKEMCCVDESYQPTESNSCSYYFSFNVDLDFTKIKIVGLNAEENVQITISNSQGVVVDEAFDSQNEYDMSTTGDDYTVCITQTNAEGCSFTYCKCIYIGCPQTKFTTLVYESSLYYQPVQEPGFNYYTLSSTNPHPGYNYDSRVPYIDANGDTVYWIAHHLVPIHNYTYSFYNENGCLLEVRTIHVKYTNTSTKKNNENLGFDKPNIFKNHETDLAKESTLNERKNSEPYSLTLIPNPNVGTFQIANIGQVKVYDKVTILSSIGQIIFTEGMSVLLKYLT